LADKKHWKRGESKNCKIYASINLECIKKLQKTCSLNPKNIQMHFRNGAIIDTEGDCILNE